MRRGVRMTRAPPVQPSERILFLDRPANLDERMFRCPLSRRLYPRWLTCLFLVLRRPGCVPHSFFLMPLRQLEQGVDRARMTIDFGMTVADLAKTIRHRFQIEVFRL